MIPGYKFIKEFSERIKSETNLRLSSYGINGKLPDNYKVKNGTADFKISYVLNKDKEDVISIDEARAQIICLVESFINELNSNLEIRPYLDFFPCTDDMVTISLYFEDQNRVDLGNGICYVYYSKGKIEYERYEIEKYTDCYTTLGKHFIVSKESYSTALETVKNQGLLTIY